MVARRRRFTARHAHPHEERDLGVRAGGTKKGKEVRALEASSSTGPEPEAKAGAHRTPADGRIRSRGRTRLHHRSDAMPMERPSHRRFR